ncbi:tetratricopeptide repeat protein [Thermosulfuriphilus ammonigenes]|uniref:Tetratricopeptide repeat protein n=1 Tax=Thermosulfuriphilus ammonigenes TaxID=1936021 RepID=A0A6G7PWK9_9BACT|nr:YcaO-like family protein [Thermosulfuriphilus ammonigenes]MBA2847799.1 ribosomal protein S12 methylthiotransferase accessory factor [Thermosulfuriphilus ammonigenes]QIJ72000.1 tetratricopeptide repeat protein [Thermosulfuriphilus ammonigenes]
MEFLKDSFKQTGRKYDKVFTPEETIQRVRRILEERGYKICRDLVRIDKGRLGIPVYISLYSAEAASLTGFHKQMGKGAEPLQAEASALMELVERFSLFSFVKQNKYEVETFSRLGEEAIDLEELFRAVHDEENLSNDRLRELLQEIPFHFTKAYDVRNQKMVSIPFFWFWLIHEYNGSAAGNSLAEAAVQATCELVERHVSSLVTYETLRTPTIHPASLSGSCAELLERFTRLGIKVWLKDFTLGLGIPSVGALAIDPSTYPHRSEIVYTAGTATSPERALIRALTEVAQLAGDFDTDGKYAESGLPKFATLDEAQYVIDTPSLVNLSDLPSVASDNFREEVEALSQALNERGLNLYLVDITHPEIGVPAVYAVIPGCHFRDRTIGIDLPFHLARLLAERRPPAEALKWLGVLDEVCPNRFDIAFYQGVAYEGLGAYDQALASFERALALNPRPEEIANIYCHIGLCHKEKEDYRQAISALEKAASYNNGLKEIFNLKGFCHYKLKEHEAAIACFVKAIEIDPTSAIDYANIGSNFRELGLYREAIRWYETALSLDPGIDFARENLERLKPLIEAQTSHG